MCFQYAYPEFTRLATYIPGSKICNSLYPMSGECMYGMAMCPDLLAR